jgi:hypothetical protein
LVREGVFLLVKVGILVARERRAVRGKRCFCIVGSLGMKHGRPEMFSVRNARFEFFLNI